MFQEALDILVRSRHTMAKDACGIASLFVLLFAGLYLSGAA